MNESQPSLPIRIAAHRAAVYGVVGRWVIHDLRNPAQVLTLLTDLLADPDGLDDDLRAALMQAGRHLAGTVELLDQALRIPPTSPEPEPTDVGGIIGRVAELQRCFKSVTMTVEPIERSLPAVCGIDAHLEHVLLSLVVHATESLAAQERGVIRMRAAQEGGIVMITVEYDGDGTRGRVMSEEGVAVCRALLSPLQATLDADVRDDLATSRFVVKLTPWSARVSPQR